jgi:formylglycine-generating enzyme required for sulfatase activity
MPQRFRVALSFPGEHRGVVKAVADRLVEKLGEGTVFYDEYFEYALARPNLDTYLQTIYHDNADLVVVFLCADYEKKEWCGVELRAIKDLIKQRKDDMIMPLRLDKEEVRGFLSIDGALYLDNRPAAAIAELVVKRLDSLKPPMDAPRNRLPSPYRGLEAFRMEDEKFFFGRKAMIRLLFDKINLVETLAVVGASGVGKSSLIQAGLLPRLKEKGWLILSARLSDAPFLNLAIAMAEQFDEPPAALAVAYEARPARLLEDLRKAAQSDKHVVIYIDQFEEVFTLSAQDAQGRLLDALFSRSAALAKWASDRLKVVISFRSEFQDLAMRHPSLRATLEKCGTQPVGEMSEDEVREAIKQPAWHRGAVEVQSELVERIVREVGEVGGGLPLLEYCLTRLWHEQEPAQGDKLTLAAYAKIGGFRGAISSHAENVLDHLRRDGQETAVRKLLLQLVKLDPEDPKRDARQPTTMAHLASIPGLGGLETVKAIVGKLTSTNMRLLVQDKETIEIAHEALIREWKTLKDWIDEDRKFQVKKERVERAARDKEPLPDPLLEECASWLAGPQSSDFAAPLGRYIQHCLDVRAAEQVDALMGSVLDLVPAVVAEFVCRLATLTLLVQCWKKRTDPDGRPLTPERIRRIRLAVLRMRENEPKSEAWQEHEDQLVEETCSDLLDAAGPADLPVIREALAPHRDALVERLWAVLGEVNEGADRRFRAASVLATYDPKATYWSRVSSFVVEKLLALVNRDPSEYASLVETLRPIREPLLAPLAAVFRERTRSDSESSMATNILADYFADQPPALADLLQDADAKQFGVLFGRIEPSSDQVLGNFQRTVATSIDSQESQEKKEHLAKRQGNAAAALLMLNQAENAWPLLKHGPDPRVRAYLIHRFHLLRCAAESILGRLGTEVDVSIRRALLLSLGRLGPEQLPLTEKERLVPGFLEVFQNDPDPGIHGAVDWLLRKWRQNDKLSAIESGLATGKIEGKRGWFVNNQGHTMVVVDGPVEFWMGSPPTESDREGGASGKMELYHRERIGHSYALASKEVTVAQARQCPHFLKHFSNDQYSPTVDCPVNNVTWYQAAAYCNWLSEKENIPKDQWCYEPNRGGEYAEGMKVAPHSMQLTGYRQPTEAEWEYACRAGASTSRYYGETEELLREYAWYVRNSHERSMVPVGSLLPNDLGLFDMLGNALEWCLNEKLDYQAGRPGEAVEHFANIGGQVPIDVERMLRGSSFPSLAWNVRCAYRAWYQPAYRYVNIGFRPARTLTALAGSS